MEIDFKDFTNQAFRDQWGQVAYQLGLGDRKDAGYNRLKGFKSTIHESDVLAVQKAQIAVDEIKEKIRQHKASYERNGGDYTYYQNGKEMRGKSKDIPYSLPKQYQKELTDANRLLSDRREVINRKSNADRINKQKDDLIEAALRKKLNRDKQDFIKQGIKITNDGSINQNDLINKARAHVNSNTNANGKGKRPKLKRPRRR